MKTQRMIRHAVAAAVLVVLVPMLHGVVRAEDYRDDLSSNAGRARTKAVEDRLRAENIAAPGPAPAIADIQLFVAVNLPKPAPIKPGNEARAVPRDALPILGAQSSFNANNGTKCYLLDPVDFTETDPSGKLLAEVKVGAKTAGAAGVPRTLILMRTGVCRTDAAQDKILAIPSLPNQPHEVSIRYATVVTRVADAQGQAFHRVKSLAEDPARGYVAWYDRLQGMMVISFGPSAIGTVNVTYRQGGGMGAGGLNENVGAGTIQVPLQTFISFPGNPSPAIAAEVKASLVVKNPEPARGAEDAPFNGMLEKLLAKNDPVSWDVLAMPTDFGRVYKAGHSGSSVFVISRDGDGALVKSPQRLKTALETYLNSTPRSAHLGVSDAKLVNLRLRARIGLADGANAAGVLSSASSQIQAAVRAAALDVGEAFSLDGLTKVVQGINGVSSVAITAESVSGTVNNRVYSDDRLTVAAGGTIVAPADTVFDVRYPDADIVVDAAH